MLDLVKDETERIDSRFLEPACGDGNYLVQVLRRKLAAMELKYGKSEFERGYYALLEAFEATTGCGVIVNTSFNVRGEPIVCTPADAYRCFMRTEMDLLVLENFVLEKASQKPLVGDTDWRKEFELD